MNYGQAAAFVEALAQLHAPWLDSPEIAAGGIFGPASGLAERTARLHSLYFDRMASPAHWEDCMKSPRGAAVPRVLQDVDRFVAGQLAMYDVHRAVAKTVIHGDEHLGNLYLDGAGSPGFLD